MWAVLSFLLFSGGVMCILIGIGTLLILISQDGAKELKQRYGSKKIAATGLIVTAVGVFLVSLSMSIT